MDTYGSVLLSRESWYIVAETQILSRRNSTASSTVLGDIVNGCSDSRHIGAIPYLAYNSAIECREVDIIERHYLYATRMTRLYRRESVAFSTSCAVRRTQYS